MRTLLYTLGAVAGGAFLQRKLRDARRISLRGRVVLITGGSRGLGLELARRFAAEGARLALLARDRAELERARQDLAAVTDDVLLLPVHVADREAVEGAVAEVVERWGRLDVVVNNAGVIQAGPFEHMQEEDFAKALDVHVWGPLRLIRAALPHLRRQEGARIVNISSIGGLVAVPHLLPYSVSKFALTGLSDGLRAELAKDGIRVTTVAPGLLRTGSHVQVETKGQHEKEMAWFAVSDANPLLSMSSGNAADQILDACRYGDPRLIITPQAKLAYALGTLAPGLYSGASKLAARLLPSPTGPDGDHVQKGYDSPSRWAPSKLTQLADEQIARNNEL